MKEIDWSKAPGGATHWCAGNGNPVTNYWYKFDKDIFWFCSEDGEPWGRFALTIARKAMLVELPTNTQTSSALDVQIGGQHYKDYAIQPVEFIYKNKIPYIEGCAIKYLCRWREKGGIEDLRKVKHYIDLLIEMELRND